MEQVNLEQFIFNSCKYLNISIKPIGNHIYLMEVPENLHNKFIDKQFKISFVKIKDKNIEFLNQQSYLVKKISKLILESNSGIASIIQNISLHDIKQKFINQVGINNIVNEEEVEHDIEDFLLVWSKITIRGYRVEEYLNTFRYNFQTGDVDDIEYRSINSLTNAIEIENCPVSIDDIKEAMDIINFAIKEKAHFIAKKKQEENDLILNEELDRIYKYYFIVEAEMKNKVIEFTDEDYDDLENIKIERENLIEQQTNKYNVNVNDISIETTSIIFFRRQFEKQKLIIKQNGEQKNILLTSKKQI